MDSLSGVVPSGLGETTMSVWGSNPEETRYYIDEVPIPFLLFQGGLRSVAARELTRQVLVQPGAFESAHGNTTGGNVLVLRGLAPDPDCHGSATVDTLDTAGYMQCRLGSSDDAFHVAYRRGYASWLNSLRDSQDAAKIYPIPNYRTYDVGGRLIVGDAGLFEVSVFGARDTLDRSITTPDPSETQNEDRNRGFSRVSVAYRGIYAERSQLDILAYLGRDTDSLILVAAGKRFGQAQDARRFGSRVDYGWDLSRRFAMHLGLDLDGTSSRHTREGSLTLPPREGDVGVFGQRPRGDVASDEWEVQRLTMAPFASLETKLGPLKLQSGLRFEHYYLRVSKELPTAPRSSDVGSARLERYLEPRLSALWRVTPEFSLDAAFGLHHASPEAEDLSATFGNPSLSPAAARHASVGWRTRLEARLTMRQRLFYKLESRLAVRPVEAARTGEQLVADGTARSLGASTELEFRAAPTLARLSYTLSRSERRASDDSQYRVFDEDRTHVLNLLLSHELAGFVLGYRFRAATGRPETPVVAAYYDVTRDDYQPIFGAPNSLRLPAQWQLDFSAERRFPVGERLVFTGFIDVQNVTNHSNVEQSVYSPSYSRRAKLEGLPTLAIVGLRAEL